MPTLKALFVDEIYFYVDWVSPSTCLKRRFNEDAAAALSLPSRACDNLHPCPSRPQASVSA